MSYEQETKDPFLFRATSARNATPQKVDEKNVQWRLLGRYRAGFVKEMKSFASCPANIFYWTHDPLAYALADDIQSSLSDAGWNVTLEPDSKKLAGIRIITRSPHLHAEEISHLVAHLRGLGFETKVRVRPELETESVQIVIGAPPTSHPKNQS